MPSDPQLTARPYAGEADLQPICDLINYCTDVDQFVGWYATPEQLAHDFAEPGQDAARDVYLWEDPTGRLLGYGWIVPSRVGDGPVVDVLLRMMVHPPARPQRLETEIIQWARERAQEIAQEHGQAARLTTYFRDGTPEYSAYRRGILEAAGFTPARTAWQMARSLDQPIPEPQLPPGFTVRTSAGPADAAAWVDCFNDSFGDNWNFYPATLEECLSGYENPLYNRDLDLVALAPDGTFAAFCFCVIDQADNAHHQRKRGDINELGTRRAYRQRGLGRAMLLAGLHRLRAAGMDTATLWVDSENPTGAVRLYQAVGFDMIAYNINYRKDL